MTPLLPPSVERRIEQLAEARVRLMAGMRADSAGLAWCAEHASIVDAAVVAAVDALRELLPDAPRFAVVATGGFGRRELAPYSDVDLTVVPGETDSASQDEALRRLFRGLERAVRGLLGLDLSYAICLAGDAPALDPATRSGLLDARLVAGSQTVFANLLDAFWAHLPAAEFILAKLDERAAAIRRHNDSPLSVEPNLKEGAGGLRDFHAANWIRAAINERPIRPDAAYERLIRARNLLQRAAGRRQDLLTRTRQAQVCDEFGLDRDEFMEGVLTAADQARREFETTLDHVREAPFQLAPGVLARRSEARVIGGADPGAAAVGVALATRLGLRVCAEPVPFGQAVDGPAALFACASGEPTLRNLDRCGLLGALLPELTACRTFVPPDASHQYTVFEHTLRTVAHLDRAAEDPFLRALRDRVSDLEPLYLALLLHDVGKRPAAGAEQPGDHAETGAIAALALCARWGLSAQTSALVAWLVREHLTMSLVMRLRDLESPETIAEFAALVENPERLAMLALLTWADISAVADDAFTAAQGAFLRELHGRTEAALEAADAEPAEPAVVRRRLTRQLAEGADELEVERFLDSLPAYYLATTPPEVAREHVQLAREAARGEPTVLARALADLACTEITVCAGDRPGLLSEVLGVLYAFDLSVSGVRACTTRSATPIAIDVFSANFGGRPIPGASWRHAGDELAAVLRGDHSVADVLRAKGKDPDLVQEVLDATFFDGDPAVLELQAPRGRGMAYRVARRLSEGGFNIRFARVGQWGGNAAAAFYLEARPDATERIGNLFPQAATSGAVTAPTRPR